MNTIAMPEAPTGALVWLPVVGSPIGEELLEWPPDLFAPTDLLLRPIRCSQQSRHARIPSCASVPSESGFWLTIG
jgi:hypothetical protein